MSISAYISKLPEHAVFNQIHVHIVWSGLYPSISAHHQHHSTERVLVKVANDILLNMNSQRVTLLVLLDFSAAFDLMDNGILLRRLSTRFGIDRRALEWFSSYLLGRGQHILFNRVKSSICASVFHREAVLVHFSLWFMHLSPSRQYKRTYLTLIVSLMTLNNFTCPLSPIVWWIRRRRFAPWKDALLT